MLDQSCLFRKCLAASRETILTAKDSVGFNMLLRAFDATPSMAVRPLAGWRMGLQVLGTFLAMRLIPRVITFSSCVGSCAAAAQQLQLQELQGRVGETERDRERPRETERDRERPRETERDRERPRETERDRERPRETERDQERPRETERDRERPRETERDRERPRETERDREREDFQKSQPYYNDTGT